MKSKTLLNKKESSLKLKTWSASSKLSIKALKLKLLLFNMLKTTTHLMQFQSSLDVLMTMDLMNLLFPLEISKELTPREQCWSLSSTLFIMQELKMDRSILTRKWCICLSLIPWRRLLKLKELSLIVLDLQELTWIQDSRIIRLKKTLTH